MTDVNLSTVTLPTPDGATLSFADSAGSRLILLIANQKTGKAVSTVAQTLLSDPVTATVPIVQIAHLVGVPRLVRKLAQMEIRQGQAAQRRWLQQHLAAQGRPDDSTTMVRLGLDWTGEVTAPLGFSSADEQPLLAIVDEHGTVHVVASGDVRDLQALAIHPAERPR